MSDDLRDKFGSDDDYDDFKNSYGDYKDKKGMFNQQMAREQLESILKVEALIYKNFVLGKKKYFKLPDDLCAAKNMSLYMFHLKNHEGYDEIASIYLN
jgi:hypothetical protein